MKKKTPKKIATATDMIVWLSPPEVAERLKCSVGTLANWRSQGCGPKFRHMGKSKNSPVRYHLNDIEKWEKKWE